MRRLLVMTAALAVAVGCSEPSPAGDTLAGPRAHVGGEDGGETSQITYSGRATGVDATVLGETVRLADTGPLPESGGAREATLLEAEVPGVLTAEVLHASTVGQGTRSHSEASTSRVRISVEGHEIEADFLMAEATARCEDGQVVLEGHSDVARLTVDGTTVTVTGEPNQRVDLSPAGHVVINEQTRGDEEITVVALRVVIPGAADIQVSRAYADIHGCAGTCVAVGDFVTGGGWIAASGSRANFGVAGGLKNDGLWGHLTYQDHGAGTKVKDTEITAYEKTGENSRAIEGTARIDGSSGEFRVEVTDNGEPGRDDVFRIRLSNGYQAEGTLRGGNIQLHPEPGGCP